MIEVKILKLHKEEYVSGSKPQESSDFISSFLKGTKKSAVGIYGGNYFCVTYPFIGSVSTSDLAYSLI